MKKKIHVVGGGFSGLTLSLELARRGFSVELHEKSDRLGGMLKTERPPYGLIETAANGILSTPAVEELFERLQIQPLSPLKASKKRYFFRDSLKQWPLKFGESLRFIARVFYHLISAKRSLTPQRMETLQRWGERNLGRAPTQYLLTPALQGIYAGDAQQLSASLIFGSLFGPLRKKTKNRRYRGTISAREGMQEVIDALEKAVRENGVTIHRNAEVDLRTLREHPVVVATSVSAAVELLWPVEPELASTLRRINTAPLISVTCFFNRYQTRYPGFGALIPRNQNLRTLGVLFNSYIFAGRDSFYSETFILGGASDSKIAQLSDDDIRELIAKERKILFGESLGVIESFITRWPAGLPHYDLSLEQVLKEISLPHNIYLHGNYLGGIGLSKILERSIELAKEIEKNEV